MPDLPTGTITILFTDLVDHSSLYARLGQGEARSVILSHFRVLRGVVAEHGGHEVKEEGDRLMVAFGSAGAALHAAIAMQQSVARANQAQPRHSLSDAQVQRVILDDARTGNEKELIRRKRGRHRRALGASN